MIVCCVGIIRQTQSVFSATPIRRRETTCFSCTYSTSRWQENLNCLTDSSHGSTTLFLLRSVFQAAVHSLWRERNGRRHGEASHGPTLLVSLVDKHIRNRIDSSRGKLHGHYSEAMQLWFATRWFCHWANVLQYFLLLKWFGAQKKKIWWNLIHSMKNVQLWIFKHKVSLTSPIHKYGD